MMTAIWGIVAGALIAAALTLPAVWPLVRSSGDGLARNSTQLTPDRSFDEARSYSAQWFAYALPSPDNPLFGRFTADRYAASLAATGSNLTELSLYPGWMTLLLALMAVIAGTAKQSHTLSSSSRIRPLADTDIGDPAMTTTNGSRTKPGMTPRHRSLVWFLVLLTLTGLWLSFAPTVPFGPWQLPTLAPQLTEWFPFLRVFSRFGLFVTIGLTALAAIGLDRLLTYLKHPTFKVGFIGLVIVGSVAELLIWPALHTIAVGPDAVPAVYRQISRGSRLVEYPLLPADEPAGEVYLLWNRLTDAKLLNADPTKTDGDLAALHDPRRTETIDGLIAAGVEFIIVHHELYTPELIRKQPAATTYGTVPILKDPRTTLIGQFGSIDLYALQR